MNDDKQLSPDAQNLTEDINIMDLASLAEGQAYRTAANQNYDLNPPPMLDEPAPATVRSLLDLAAEAENQARLTLEAADNANDLAADLLFDMKQSGELNQNLINLSRNAGENAILATETALQAQISAMEANAAAVNHALSSLEYAKGSVSRYSQKFIESSKQSALDQEAAILAREKANQARMEYATKQNIALSSRDSLAGIKKEYDNWLSEVRHAQENLEMAQQNARLAHHEYQELKQKLQGRKQQWLEIGDQFPDQSIGLAQQQSITLTETPDQIPANDQYSEPLATATIIGNAMPTATEASPYNTDIIPPATSYSADNLMPADGISSSDPDLDNAEIADSKDSLPETANDTAAQIISQDPIKQSLPPLAKPMEEISLPLTENLPLVTEQGLEQSILPPLPIADSLYNENEDEPVIKKRKPLFDTYTWRQTKVWEYGRMVLLALALVVILRNFVFNVVVVEGVSMLPTLYENDQLINSKISYLFNEPQRGDIVLVETESEGLTQFLVKRIVALPNERIAIKNGVVYIDDQLLDEDYLVNVQTEGDVDQIVPEDHYFVMGDNRPASYDSRYDSIGSIEAEQIDGKAVLRIFPFDNIAFLN